MYCSANSSEIHSPLQNVAEAHYFKNIILSNNKCYYGKKRKGINKPTH